MSATKPIIFISHISEESPVAIALQAELEGMFGAAVSVFVSSDKKSIHGGDEWFQAINKNLVACDVLIALLSDISVHRPWIPYEMGVAMGAKARVLPLTIRNSAPAKLPYPFAGFQVWSILDITSIMLEISQRIDRPYEAHTLGAYQEAIEAAEAKVTYKRFRIEPVLFFQRNGNGEGHLRLEIENVGNADLDLLYLELLIPTDLKQPNWSVHTDSSIQHSNTWRGDNLYNHLMYSVLPSSPTSLFSTLTPSMGTRLLARPYFIFKRDLSFTDQQKRIFYHLHVRGLSSEEDYTSYAAMRTVYE
jgi:hypothetical protein